MATVPSKVQDRLSAGIKRFQPILTSAKSRDVNESDTVIIVTDMLAEIFGFQKYSEITSEYSIRGTFVDLAIKLDGSLQLLIEVKAIGLQLKESYIKQAVDYGANQGAEWVVLTNGAFWQIYKISFGKPISQELVLEIDFLNLNPKKSDDAEGLYLLTREGIAKSMLGEYHAQRLALSRYFIGATVLSEPVLDVIRRELRRISLMSKLTMNRYKKFWYRKFSSETLLRVKKRKRHSVKLHGRLLVHCEKPRKIVLVMN